MRESLILPDAVYFNYMYLIHCEHSIIKTVNILNRKWLITYYCKYYPHPFFSNTGCLEAFLFSEISSSSFLVLCWTIIYQSYDQKVIQTGESMLALFTQQNTKTLEENVKEAATEGLFSKTQLSFGTWHKSLNNIVQSDAWFVSWQACILHITPLHLTFTFLMFVLLKTDFQSVWVSCVNMFSLYTTMVLVFQAPSGGVQIIWS